MSSSESHKSTDAENAAPKGAEVISRAEEVPSLSPDMEIESVVQVRHERYVGPLPHPQQLKDYEAVLPGTAQIILNEFQANGKHVREMEARALEAVKSDNDLNRISAACLVLVALGVVVFLAWIGRENVAIAVACTTVAAVIMGFLNQGQRQREKNQDADSAE